MSLPATTTDPMADAVDTVVRMVLSLKGTSAWEPLTGALKAAFGLDADPLADDPTLLVDLRRNFKHSNSKEIDGLLRRVRKLGGR